MDNLASNLSKVEGAIIEYLDGKQQKNALQLVAYLNDNGLSPIALPYEMDNGNTIGCKIPHEGHYLGWVLVKKNGEWAFQIFNFLDFGESIHSDEKDESFKKAVHDHVSICKAPCHDECWRAKDAKIFGREFKSVCSQHSLDFINPDEKTMGHIKKLIEYSRKTKPYDQQYHPNFL